MRKYIGGFIKVLHLHRAKKGLGILSDVFCFHSMLVGENW